MSQQPNSKSSRLQWLDRPSEPDAASLTRIREALEGQQDVREAWLVATRVTPDGQEPHEEMACAVTVTDAVEPTSLAGAELIASLASSLRGVFPIGSWIFVNDGIREKTERHGLRIFSRTP
jgi:hypothetical protein